MGCSCSKTKTPVSKTERAAKNSLHSAGDGSRNRTRMQNQVMESNILNLFAAPTAFSNPFGKHCEIGGQFYQNHPNNSLLQCERLPEHSRHPWHPGYPGVPFDEDDDGRPANDDLHPGNGGRHDLWCRSLSSLIRLCRLMCNLKHPVLVKFTRELPCSGRLKQLCSCVQEDQRAEALV